MSVRPDLEVRRRETQSGGRTQRSVPMSDAMLQFSSFKSHEVVVRSVEQCPLPIPSQRHNP